MVALFNGAEGGAVGATVSAGNSGDTSGDAWDGVVGTPTITYDNAFALGTRSYLISNAPSTQQMFWSTKLGTVSELWGRFYLRYSALPNTPIGLVRPTTGGSQAARIRLNNDGTLTISDSGNAAEVTTVAALPTAQFIRVEWHIQFVATSAVVELKTFNSSQSLTPTENLSTSASGIGVNCDAVQFGAFTSGSFVFSGWMDGIAVHDDPSIGFLGPYRSVNPVRGRLQAVNRAATY